ncbi:MAG: hypothetical protein IKQ79_05335 [Bacteroidales bacterium]|nr:hypothetical protein [Bacteroidales bacterium]MBR6929125.1 hypothetical protein [Bacteroidales bacterium]
MLLYSSFPGLFNGDLNFSFQQKWDESARDYIVILIMIVVLFIVDAVYNLIKTRNNYTPFILGGAGLFLVFMAFSLKYCGSVFFIAGWVVLSLMKLLTTEPVTNTKPAVYQHVTED